MSVVPLFRPDLEIVDRGRGNRVVSDWVTGSGRIELDGDDITVVIGAGSSLDGVNLHLGTGSSFVTGEHCELAALQVFGRGGARIVLGRHVIFSASALLFIGEPAAVEIGSRTLIGGSTWIGASDGYRLFDRATGERLNPPADVRLGERVMICERARIHRGVSVGDGAVIGAGSVVETDVPPAAVAAGVPARVVREGVRWDYDPAQLSSWR